MVIWAAALGQGPRVAWYRLPGVALADDPPVRITFGAPCGSQVRIVDPDRKPVAGARVSPTRAGGILVPGPLGQALAATSDANGGATIAGLSPGVLDEVRVSAGESGEQVLEMPDSRLQIQDSNIQNNESINMLMAPVGRIQGRLVSPHGEPIRGVTIRATSQVGGYPGSGQGGVARAACDEQGRFVIPAIAAGMMTLEPEYDPERGSVLRNWPLSRILVRAGRTTELMIPMHPTVKVQGLVREKGTGRPIAGAAVMWYGLFDGYPVADTDASGAFRGFIAREEIFAVPSPDPRAEPVLHARRRGAGAAGPAAARVDEATLQPTELPQGRRGAAGRSWTSAASPSPAPRSRRSGRARSPGSARRGPTPRAGSCCTGPIPGPSWSSGPGMAWSARPPCRTPPVTSPPGRSS